MNKADEDKQKLIYILSNGRSGSTLLDLLLGAHPSIWTFGEAQILPWAIRKQDITCGCGLTILHCPFWTALLPDLPIRQQPFPIHYFRESPGGGKALRMKGIICMMSGLDDQQRAMAIAEYGASNAEYFSRVRQAAETVRNGLITWLVNASKDPYRLLWLHKSERFNLRVIHLVRGPRAFVHSMRLSTSGVRPGTLRLVLR